MTESAAVKKWRTTMEQVGPDGLTGFQRRGANTKAAKLASDPDYFKKWVQKAMQTMGEDGLKARGQAINNSLGPDGIKARNKSIAVAKCGVGKPLQRYRRSVTYFTLKNDLSQLPNWKKPGYQIDHIFSVLDGFKLGVDPRVVANIANLQILTRKENREKSNRSDQTLEQLMEKIS